MKLIFTAILLALLVACSNPEQEALALLDKAQNEKSEGSFTHSIEMYRQIVSLYPETQVARQVKEQLPKMEQEERLLIKSAAAIIALALDIYRLEHQYYPETGVDLMSLQGMSNLPAYRIAQFSYTQTSLETYQLKHLSE